MESAKKTLAPEKKAKFITPEKTAELRSTVHFRIRVPVPVWYGGSQMTAHLPVESLLCPLNGDGIPGWDMEVSVHPYLRGLPWCIYDFVCLSPRGTLPGRFSLNSRPEGYDCFVYIAEEVEPTLASLVTGHSARKMVCSLIQRQNTVMGNEVHGNAPCGDW
uniref:Uncharacterized protein n=1 Tax=Fagus sylvatica TaxID=28930 RepID=A0A2N9I756_FAGSY